MTLRRRRTMNILYFAFSSPKYDGVTKKIISQHKNICKNNLDIKTYLIGNSVYDKEVLEKIKNNNIKAIALKEQDASRNKYLKRTKKFNIMMDIIKKNDPVATIVYLRYPAADTIFYKFIKEISCCGYSVITEHQEKENSKMAMFETPLRFFLELVYGRLVREKIAGYVAVTNEILEYQIGKYGKRKAGIVIGNGIEVEESPMRIAPSHMPDKSNALKILFVGSGYYIHGLDRLVKGMLNYHGKIEIETHILGNGPEMPRLKKIINNTRVENKIIFHDYLTGPELDKMFNTCHIAVGGMGFHRKNLKETSELKAREYCARGIPFISSGNDADFPTDFVFRYGVKPDESPLDMNEVIAFSKKVLSDPLHPNKMREYAKKNLEWYVKMERIKQMIEDIKRK
jgi:hypothetical protein